MNFIIGCTGCGKGAIGRAAAERLGGQIVSLDSMKVYRRMNIGTAKPTAEDRRRVVHHLIDVVDPSESFTVAKYVSLADRAIAQIAAQSKPVLAVGGTALYIKAVSQGLFEGPGADPEFRTMIRERARLEGPATLHAELAKVDPAAAQRIHPNDIRRIERALEVRHLTGMAISELQKQWNSQATRYDCRFVGLRRDKADQSSRINRRVERMVQAGWVEETRSLMAEDPPPSAQAWQCLGYEEMARCIRGECALAEATEQVKIKTRQFAKHQRTWFRRFANVQWIDVPPDEAAEAVAERVVEQIEEGLDQGRGTEQ